MCGRAPRRCRSGPCGPNEHGRRGTRAPDTVLGTRANAGPVLLTTFDVPFDTAATTFAVHAAAEASRALIVANVVELPYSGRVGWDIEYTPEMEASLSAPVELGLAQGLHVERLRVKSFRRVVALVDVAGAQRGDARARPGTGQRVSARLTARRHRRCATSCGVSYGSAGTSRRPDTQAGPPRPKRRRAATSSLTGLVTGQPRPPVPATSSLTKPRNRRATACGSRLHATPPGRMPRRSRSHPVVGSASRRGAGGRDSNASSRP